MGKFRDPKIEWGADPGGDLPALIPIMCAPQMCRYYFVAVNDFIESCYVHWHLNRTIPCIGRDNGCICTVLGIPTRWKGYIGAWDPAAERLILAEVTRDAVRHCRQQMDLMCESIRGKAFCMWRIGKNANSPARIDLAISRMPMDQVPPPFDARAALLRIWNGPNRDK